MTIETPTAVPSGWYPDPAQSGGHRWWDGFQWTDHVREPGYVEPPVAPAPPVQQVANPYGLPAARGENYSYAASRPSASTPSYQVAPPISNTAAWLALVFGVVSLGLSLIAFLPGSKIFYVSTTGVVAIIWGVRALVRRANGHATVLWAPIVGMALGVVATLLMAGEGIVSAVVAPHSSAYSLSTPGPISPSVQAKIAQDYTPLQYDGTAPIAFASSPDLTGYERDVATIVRAVEQRYAGGNSQLSAGQSWPTSVTQTANNTMVAPDGTVIATVPAGVEVRFTLSPDLTGFSVVASNAGEAEIAGYSSRINQYGWTCLKTDTNCVPSS